MDKMAAMLRDVFGHIFVNEKCCMLIKNILKFIRKVPLDNNLALV